MLFFDYFFALSYLSYLPGILFLSISKKERLIPLLSSLFLIFRAFLSPSYIKLPHFGHIILYATEDAVSVI